jgi:hypothetical protein
MIGISHDNQFEIVKKDMDDVRIKSSLVGKKLVRFHAAENFIEMSARRRSTKYIKDKRGNLFEQSLKTAEKKFSNV